MITSITRLGLTAFILAATIYPAMAAPADRAQVVAPFLDKQAIAVGHLDLTRVEIEPLVEQLRPWIPEWEPNRERWLQNIRQQFAALKETGARELYLVVSLADIPEHPPLVLAPLGERVKEEALRRLFGMAGMKAERFGAVLALGAPETLARLETLEPDARPELEDAFAAAGDAPLQLLLVPTDLQRRIVAEMMPELPKEMGGGPTTILTRGMIWAALGVNLPPRPALHLVVQSENATAAAALRDKWLQATGWLAALRVKWLRETRWRAAQEAVDRKIAALDQLAPLLMPTTRGDRLVLDLTEKEEGVAKLLAALEPAARAVRVAAMRRESVNRLKQLGLAMHNYHDVYKHFPLPASLNKEGKQLLSWRVLVLPFIEQADLYRQFHLDEPWDSPHNRKLIDKMPDIYRSPLQSREETSHTTYVVPVGNGAIFDKQKPTVFKQITDGTSNTIMTVEVDPKHAVIWTKPDNLSFNPKQPFEGIGKPYPKGFNAGFADGSVHFLPYTLPDATLRALFTRAGGEVVQLP